VDYQAAVSESQIAQISRLAQGIQPATCGGSQEKLFIVHLRSGQKINPLHFVTPLEACT
jgi:hypothetical protein